MEKLHSQLISFFYVAHFKSFTKAATHLQCSKSYMSKQISELENSIGTALFHRSTRVMQLTHVGESIFEHSRLIVEEFQSVENTIAGLHQKAAGLLRLTAPVAYADYVLAPNLIKFLDMYPNITLDMNFTGQLLNLVDEKIDIAIRLTHEPPLDRIARRVGEYQMVVCASSDYFSKNSTPKLPGQLPDHACLVYSTEKNYKNWPFLINGQTVLIDVTPKLITNNSQILLRAALAGAGIARLPSYVVHEAIQRNDLIPILSNFYPIAIPVYAIYAWSRIIPPKIHAFTEFLKEVHHTSSYKMTID